MEQLKLLPKIIQDPSRAYLVHIAPVYKEVFEKLSVDAVLYSEESLIRFQSIPEEEQIKCLQRLESELGFLNYLSQEIERYDQDITNNSFVLDAAQKHYNFKISDDFLNTVTNDMIVEIYDMTFIQVFRNFVLLELCGYDLLDLSSQNWKELFHRPTNITNALEAEAMMVVTKQPPVAHSKVPTHFMKERYSKTQQVVEIQQIAGSPIFNSNGDLAGFIGSQLAKVVSTNRNKNEISFI